MDIMALIKFSSICPQGQISRATGEYLLSMAQAEREHNERLAYLSERGARVASQPSQYWQRALATYKYARQGVVVDHYLDHLAQTDPSVLPSEADQDALIRLASENPILQKLADENVSKATLKKEDRQQQRGREQKQQKSQGKKEETQIERKTKGKTKRALLTKYFGLMTDPSTPAGLKNKVIKKVYAIIGKGGKGLKTKKDQLQIAWRNKLKEPQEVKYKGAKGNDIIKIVKLESLRDWEKIKNPKLQRVYKAIWEKEYGTHLKQIFQLAKRAVSGGGGTAKKDEGAKAEGESKSTETSSKSESGSKSEDKGIVENLMESEGINKEEAKEMAGNILGKGEDEEESDDSATGTEDSATGTEDSATGTEFENLGEVEAKPVVTNSSRRGKGEGGGKSKKQKKNKKKKRKASEEDGFSDEADFDTTDFDIIF